MAPGSEDRMVTIFNDVDRFPSSFETGGGAGAGPLSMSPFGRAPKPILNSASAEALPKRWVHTRFITGAAPEAHFGFTREAEPRSTWFLFAVFLFCPDIRTVDGRDREPFIKSHLNSTGFIS